MTLSPSSNLMNEEIFINQNKINNIEETLNEVNQILKKHNFIGHKRLIKKSSILYHKKLRKKIAKNYFDKEAELGSDNEEHDNIIKKTYNNSSSYFDSENEEENLEDLIDDNNILYNNNEQKNKFIEDMLIKDKEDILKVIEGKTKEKNFIKKYNDNNDDILPLKIRIERMKNNKEFDNDKINFKSIFSKVNKFEKEFEENDNEELIDAFNNYKKNEIKKIDEMNKTKRIELKERMKENNKILENVILLNKKENKKEKNNNLFIKGNNSLKNNRKNFIYRIGSFMNTTNSFLKNIQKENIFDSYKINMNSIKIKNLSSLFIKK